MVLHNLILVKAEFVTSFEQEESIILDKKNNTNYHDEVNKKNILHLRELLDTLPPFCAQYFRGIQEYTSSRTRIAYAYDIRVFFEYMHDSNPVFRKIPIQEYPLELLDQITRLEIGRAHV